MISDAKKRRFLSVKVSLSNHGGHSGSLATTASSMLSRLKRSCADAGITSAAGSLPCHHSMSSVTAAWLLTSILLMTTITGQSTLESLSRYSAFLSGVSTVSVT